MPDDYRTSEQIKGCGELIGKPRHPVDHLLGDPREGGYSGADAALRIDQLPVFSDHFSAKKPDDSKFNNAVAIRRRRAAGFDVNNGNGNLTKRLDE